MKILKICYEYPPLGGGGAHVVEGLSRNLVHKGHQVHLTTMGFRGLSPSIERNGFRVFRVPCFRSRIDVCYPHEMLSYLLIFYPYLLKKIMSSHYDIIHVHFILPDGILGFITSRLKGIPFIITAHGSDVPNYNPDRFKFLHRLLTPFWRFISHQSRFIICPSKSLQKLAKSASPDLATLVIPNGFEVDRFSATRPKNKQILILTRMFKRKGVQYVIRALANVEHDFKVNIVGDGPYLETLRQLATSLAVKAHFWGHLDNKSSVFRDLLETSRIFVFPSEAENFPTVLLEAMAAGMAIVTTKGTGCAEVVGDTAILVEPKDPHTLRSVLIKLMADPQRCKDMGQNARKRLESHFSWEAVSSQYLKCYQDCLSPSDSNRSFPEAARK